MFEFPAAMPTDAVVLQHELETLRGAVASRQLIGQSTGLIAAELKVTTDVAWQAVRHLSSLCNIKMRELARIVVQAHNGSLRPEDQAAADAIAAALSVAVLRAMRAPGPHIR